MRTLLFHAGLPLLLGTLVYMAWRPPTLWLFVGIDAIGLSAATDRLRQWLGPLRSALPAWFIYTLPAACWAYALSAAIMITWRDAGARFRVIAAVGVFLLVVASELAQRWSAVPGIFDPRDLTLDAAASLLAIAVLWTGPGETRPS